MLFPLSAALLVCGIAPGDRFLVAAALRATGLESAAPQPAIVDEHGAPAKIDEIENRVLVVRSVDGSAENPQHTIILELEGTYRVYRATVPVTQPGILGLAAIAGDAESVRLEARYAGRDVWTVGELQAICASGSADPMLVVAADVPAHIEHIVRLTDFTTTFADVGALGGSNGFTYSSSNPIVVQFRLPAKVVRAHDKSCDEFTARFAGTWDLERHFSLGSQHERHPEWTAAVYDEIRSQRILTDMTRDEVVAMFGYPSLPGTLDQLAKLDRWHYDHDGVFGWTVWFRGDRVWAYDPPHQLP